MSVEKEQSYQWAITLAAWSAYKRYDALLTGRPSPKQAADFKRLSDPQVGDLVVEASRLSSAIGWEDWDAIDRSVGVLLEKTELAAGDYEYTLLSLWAEPTWTFWQNARFIVIDCPPILPECPHCNGTGENCPKERVPFAPDNAKNGYCASGRWVYPLTMTRESLTNTLAASGFNAEAPAE